MAEVVVNNGVNVEALLAARETLKSAPEVAPCLVLAPPVPAAAPS